MMKNGNISEKLKIDSLEKKLTEGLRKATSKMLEKAALLDEEVVISRDGKVLKIKAKELIKS
jgi:hypothetical protein